MEKIYYKFIASLLALSTLMFCVWALVAGIENAREMLFVIAVLAACLSVKGTIHEVCAYCKEIGRDCTEQP